MTTMTENSNIGNLGLLRPDRGSELNFPELHARKDIGVAADVHNADAVIGCGDHAHSNGAKLSLGVIGSSLHYDRYTSLAVHAKSQERYADDGIEIQNSKQLDAFGEADISTFLLKANGENPAPVKFNLHNGGGASTELASAASAASLTTVDLTKAPMLEGYRVRNRDQLFSYLNKNTDLIKVLSDLLPIIKRIFKPKKVCLEYCYNYSLNQEIINVYLFKYLSDESHCYGFQNKVDSRLYKLLDNKTQEKIDFIARGIIDENSPILKHTQISDPIKFLILKNFEFRNINQLFSYLGRKKCLSKILLGIQSVINEIVIPARILLDYCPNQGDNIEIIFMLIDIESNDDDYVDRQHEIITSRIYQWLKGRTSNRIIPIVRRFM